ncbi:uncharacterized protein LOC141704392 [Apium graveolens]|uniref:uncharacterized protein LOC141704392 n=2 Tax=Apium graveolens TaxID=4045 RepID=UPI003D7981DA
MQHQDESITDYMARFIRLAGFAGTVAGTAAQQADKFKWGLKSHLRGSIISFKFDNVAEAADAAKDVEKERIDFRTSRSNSGSKRTRDDQGFTQGRHWYGGQNQNQQFQRQKQPRQWQNCQQGQSRYSVYGGNPNMIPVAPCATCGGHHPGRACYRQTGACFLCGSMPHRAKDCTVSRNPGGGGAGGGSGSGSQQNPTARVFALTAKQASANSGTISGTLLIGRRDAYVLFDTGSTHSIVSLSFVHHLGVAPSLFYPHMSISTPMGNSVVISDVYRECPIAVGDRNYKVNLLPMEMHDFDVILGMDWLSENCATIDCQGKRVIFGDADKLEFVYQGSHPQGDIKLISALKASKLFSKGCDGYLAFVKDTSKDEPSIEDYPAVREYEDVFPDELPGLPPHREVEFTIELVPGAEPISKAPYRMAPLELQELKEQLQELLDRGFIRPSVSPWGALVLVKEAQKDDTGLKAIRSEVAGGKQKHFRVDDEGMIWLGGKLCVPADPTIREKILKEAHSSSFSIHPGSTKIETTHVHELTEIFQRGIVRVHGVPVSIVSDRDTRFTSRFWKGFQHAWGDWDKYLYLVEFAYYNSWHASIGMPPFEALYGRRCRALSCWDEVGERVIEGQELVRITNEKVEKVKESLKEARSRQKSYADQHQKFGGFEPGDHGKLSLRYIGHFDVMEKVGEVSYRVGLPPQLSHVHNVFHVSVLRGYKYHPLHVVQYPLHKIREDLSCEEETETILAREGRVLRKNTIPFVKVLWKNHSEREATWELEESIREKYSHLFESSTSI